MGDLASVRILDAWRALGGPEPRRGRAPAWWRNGDNSQAISLSAEKSCWYDHRDSKGGGVLDLVQHVRGCDRASALRWLEGQGFIAPRTLAPAQRREHEQRRESARSVADEIRAWNHAIVAELNARKLLAVESGDDDALARAASLCNLLENGSPGDVIREFLRHRATDPVDVARLIADGEAHEREARRVAAEIVLLLAQSYEPGDPL